MPLTDDTKTISAKLAHVAADSTLSDEELRQWLRLAADVIRELGEVIGEPDYQLENIDPKGRA